MQASHPSVVHPEFFSGNADRVSPARLPWACGPIRKPHFRHDVINCVIMTINSLVR